MEIVIALTLLGGVLWWWLAQSSDHPVAARKEVPSQRPPARQVGRANERAKPKVQSLSARAKEEVNLVNAAGREHARKTDDWDNRIWLHEDDWPRMRSAVVVLICLSRADGVQQAAEAAIIEDWYSWRLANSHWGQSYPDSKMRALAQLTGYIIPQLDDFELCLADLQNGMSAKQKNKFLDIVQQLSAAAGPAAAPLVSRVQAALVKA